MGKQPFGLLGYWEEDAVVAAVGQAGEGSCLLWALNVTSGPGFH